MSLWNFAMIILTAFILNSTFYFIPYVMRAMCFSDSVKKLSMYEWELMPEGDPFRPKNIDHPEWTPVGDFKFSVDE